MADLINLMRHFYSTEVFVLEAIILFIHKFIENYLNMWFSFCSNVDDLCQTHITESPCFFTIQSIWIVLGRSFFEDLFTLSWFLKSNWSSDFGHPEAGSGAKKRVILRCDFICSNFKVEWETGVWTKIRLLASGFCSHAAISLWFLLFFDFLVWIFYKWFSQCIHSSF